MANLREHWNRGRAKKSRASFDENATIQVRTARREYFDAATERFGAAEQLYDARRFLSCLLLCRTAFAFLARSALVGEGNESERGVREAIDALVDPDAIDRLGDILDQEPALQRQLRTAATALRSTENLSLDKLPARELRQRADDCIHLFRKLSGLLEPLGLKERRRILGRSWVVFGAFVLVPAIGFGFTKLTSGPNIALHKRVFSSGEAMGTKAAQAVDGKRFGTYGFHSEGNESPWLVIDLGRPYRISQVDIYGRHDCCFDQSVPMLIEVSMKDADYRLIATRDTPLEHVEPWTVSVHPPAARFVRIRTAKASFLVLSEVEVQGTPVH